MIKNLLISVIAAAIVSLGVWFALPAKVSAPLAGSIYQSVDGTQANLPNPSNYDYLVARLALGLGTSLDTIRIEGAASAMNTASTTICSIKNPLNATSTIVDFAFNVTTATSSATTYAVGTSTTAYATSTSMETASLGAGNQGTITWDPSVNNSVIGPTQYVNVGNASGQVNYPFGVGGNCTAVFQRVF